MEVSRLTFTKETKDKISKGLNRRQQGKLRFEKLKEAEENGLLQKAKTRIEVAQLAGFTREQYKTGYSWVSNMLIRKHLIERISGIGMNGRAEYEYHLGSDPDYEMKGVIASRKKNNKEAEEVIVMNTRIPEPKPQVLASAIKMEITKGNLSIKVDITDSNIALDLIKQLLKGE